PCGAAGARRGTLPTSRGSSQPRSEEHTSELQSRSDLVCRLLLEKKKECRLPCLSARTARRAAAARRRSPRTWSTCPTGRARRGCRHGRSCTERRFFFF